MHLSRHTRDFIYTPTLDTTAGAIDQAAVQMKAGDAYWKQFVGVAEMLEQKHVVYDMIFDKQIDREWRDGYQVLILPNSACLSRHQCSAISDWVSAGGTLIANYETSLYDEMGVKRENFGLADVFGLDWIGTYDPSGKSGTLYVPQGEVWPLDGILRPAHGD